MDYYACLFRIWANVVLGRVYQPIFAQAAAIRVTRLTQLFPFRLAATIWGMFVRIDDFLFISDYLLHDRGHH